MDSWKLTNTDRTRGIENAADENRKRNLISIYEE